MSDLKKYISDDGVYVIPVTWESYGTIQITGCKNLEEAYEVAQEYIDELPLPKDGGDYIDGSYKLEEDEDILLSAQENYYRYDAYFKNPKSEE